MVVVGHLFLEAKAYASIIMVGPTQKFKTIQSAIDISKTGDTVLVHPYIYKEHIIISKSIKLIGIKRPVIDGDNKGHIISILARDVELSGLDIINSGKDFANSDAGIFCSKKAISIMIKDNMIKNSLWGIWVDASLNIKIIGNKIYGLKDRMSQRRGNGIHLFNVKFAKVISNYIESTRDGIYVFDSSESKLNGNTIRNLRYGIHYMHSNNNDMNNNLIENNTVGFALMFSRNLNINYNKIYNNKKNGILLRDLLHSRIYSNEIKGSEKALFFYNSLFKTVKGNIIKRNHIGAHVWAGSFENKVFDNDFINNEFQTKFVGAKDEFWTGNYWNNYLGWDLDQDKFGDIPFVGNGLVERLVWTYPMLRILLASPALQTLRMSESQFPLLRTPSIIDNRPLMTAKNNKQAGVK